MVDIFCLPLRCFPSFFISLICLLLTLLIPVTCHASENAISAGYGFGLWNRGGIGQAGRETYNYATLSYLYEKPFTPRLALVMEPFCNIINKPKEGVDVGFVISLKTYLTGNKPQQGLYLSAGGGAAYTTVNFKEQGTHGLFVLHGAIGYRHGRFFVEDRFHHYSNGGLASPNRSVNSNIVKAGYYF